MGDVIHTVPLFHDLRRAAGLTAVVQADMPLGFQLLDRRPSFLYPLAPG